MTSWPAEWFDEIDSTNEEARRRVNSGSFENCWIAAGTQTAGRGRLGRKWISPAGNLYSTVLFSIQGPISNATRIPFVSALAVADVVESLAPHRSVKLKWPNDVRFNGAKISGILVEAGQLNHGCWVAAGIGINVAEAPKNSGQPACSIVELRGGNVVGSNKVFELLRSAFSSRLTELENGFERTRAAWMERAEGLGAELVVKTGDVEQRGVFKGLGTNGELLLDLQNGDQRCITAGDVELIKERVT